MLCCISAVEYATERIQKISKKNVNEVVTKIGSLVFWSSLSSVCVNRMVPPCIMCVYVEWCPAVLTVDVYSCMGHS